jgi:hypothetical protein
MNTDNIYNPVRLKPAEEVAEKRTNDPEFRIAYDALEDEFATLAALLDARLQAELTQKSKNIHFASTQMNRI